MSEPTAQHSILTSKLLSHGTVANVILEFLGLMGLMAVFGRLSFLCLTGMFVPTLAFVIDFAGEIPDVLTTALLFPYLLIALEIMGVFYFFFGQDEHTTSYILITGLLEKKNG